jgi:hypothetical protein
MDKQEIFNTIATHLLKQGVRAIGDENSEIMNGCAYRGNGCTKCAAGVLIPDNEYQGEYEGLSVASLAGGLIHSTENHVARYRRFGAMWERLGLAQELRFIGELQTIHDNRDPETWREAFAELAQQYSLNTDVLSAS